MAAGIQHNDPSALLFQGNWNESTEWGWHFHFDHNLWFSEAQDLRTASVFGGDAGRKGVNGNTQAGGYTFGEWQAQGRDLHSVIGPPQFADPQWETTLDLRLAATSPAKSVGFQEIDVRQVGPLLGDCCGPLGVPSLPPPLVPTPPPAPPPHAPPMPPPPPPPAPFKPPPPPPPPPPHSFTFQAPVLVGRTDAKDIGGGVVVNPDNFIALDENHIFSMSELYATMFLCVLSHYW